MSVEPVVYNTNAGLRLTAERPARGAVGRLIDHVRRQYALRTPFDARLDSLNASALHCSELMAHAWATAGAAPLAPVPAQSHRSNDLFAARQELTLREALQRFIDAAMAPAGEQDHPAQNRARVAALAQRHFGLC